MHPDIERILIPEAAIVARVNEMAREISRDYAGERLLLVCILKGAAIFAADLFRALELPAELEFMAVSSYGLSSRSTGVQRILKDLEVPLEGRHVLLVEDILDTGLTMKFLREYLEQRHPASLRVAVLLDKVERRLTPVTVEYLGFEVPDEFLVGYGLDYAEKYRNLRDVCVLRRSVYAGT